MDCTTKRTRRQDAGSRSPRRNGKPQAKLERTTFKTSRLLEFCSEKELTAQIGHSQYEWPLVALKELLERFLPAGRGDGPASVGTTNGACPAQLAR